MKLPQLEAAARKAKAEVQSAERTSTQSAQKAKAAKEKSRQAKMIFRKARQAARQLRKAARSARDNAKESRIVFEAAAARAAKIEAKMAKARKKAAAKIRKAQVRTAARPTGKTHRRARTKRVSNTRELLKAKAPRATAKPVSHRSPKTSPPKPAQMSRVKQGSASTKPASRPPVTKFQSKTGLNVRVPRDFQENLPTPAGISKTSKPGSPATSEESDSTGLEP